MVPVRPMKERHALLRHTHAYVANRNQTDINWTPELRKVSLKVSRLETQAEKFRKTWIKSKIFFTLNGLKVQPELFQFLDFFLKSEILKYNFRFVILTEKKSTIFYLKFNKLLKLN